MRDDVLVDRLNGFGVRLHPAHLVFLVFSFEGLNPVGRSEGIFFNNIMRECQNVWRAGRICWSGVVGSFEYRFYGIVIGVGSEVMFVPGGRVVVRIVIIFFGVGCEKVIMRFIPISGMRVRVCANESRVEIFPGIVARRTEVRINICSYCVWSWGWGFWSREMIVLCGFASGPPR